MSNLLTVIRNTFSKEWTVGQLLVQGVLKGYTIEDEIRAVKVKGETAIPFGTYELSFRQSPKFSSSFLYSEKLNVLIEPKELSKYPKNSDFKAHDLLWVKNVPGFEYILIHWGNTDLDTEGCLVVGSKVGVLKGRAAVLSSRDFYKKLYPMVYPIVKNSKEKQFINYIRAT